MPRFLDNVSVNKSISASTLSVTSSAYIANNLSIGGNYSGGNTSNWNNTTTIINTNSASWIGGNSAFTTLNLLSTGWNSTQNSVSSLSSNWNNTQTIVNSNSATTWNYQGTDLKNLSSGWTNSQNTLSSLSANWNNTQTTVNTNSANWNIVSTLSTQIVTISATENSSYTTLNSNSANWNTAYNTTTSYIANSANPTLSSLKVNNSTLLNTLTVTGNTFIQGNLTLAGSATYVNTTVQTTSAFSVTNSGTGPALKVTQTGNNIIASFYDGTYPALVVDATSNIPGYVGIGTAIPNKTLTVIGEISATATVYASAFVGGNVPIWNTTSVTVSSLSANWNTGYNYGTVYSQNSANPVVTTLSAISVSATNFYGNGNNITGIVQRYSTYIGDGVNTAYTITHNLGTRDIITQTYDNTLFDVIYPTVTNININQITVNFTSAPPLSGIRIVVMGNSSNINASGASVINNGYVNKIINGNMLIDQRNSGVSQLIVNNAPLAYTIDRFYAYTSGASLSGQQITTNGQRRYRFTGSPSVTAVGFGQRIESFNSYDLANGTATLQCKLASSSLPSVTWTAYYANTIDTFGTLLSATKTLISTGNFLINSTEATYSTQISMPSGATTGIEILFTAGALLSAQTLTIGDVQLEAGNTISTFERPNIRESLMDCQRYFELINDISCICGTGGYTNSYSNLIFYKTNKRAIPTITLYTGNYMSGVSGSIYYSAGASNYTKSPTLFKNVENGFALQLSGEPTMLFISGGSATSSIEL